MLEQVKPYLYLMRLNKPIGILLLLWPTLWALWLASDGHPHPLVLSVFLLGVILTRSAGCIINDYADRYFDGHVERTRQRPLVTNKVSTRAALVLFCVLMLVAFMCVLLLNALTIMLAVVGALLAVIYPFLKRYTQLPQLGLGLAFSWGVPMAFSAETGSVGASAWLLFFTAVLWPVIYDTMYAMTDKKDDLKIGIKSTAILFARADRLIIALLQGLFLVGLVWVGCVFHLHVSYYISIFVAALLFVYQQYLMRNREPQRCFQAFLNNHWVGLVIFMGIALSFLL